jgi:HK97 family phage major capsid protein
MPRDVNKMKRERASVAEKMRALLDLQETRADKKLTAEENTQYIAYETEMGNRSAEIEREERLQAAEALTATGRTQAPGPNEKKSFGEFLAEVRFNPGSAALKTRERSESNGAERRDVTMGDGPSMGFLVPEESDKTIRMVTPQTAIFRPRSLVIPGGAFPDAAYNMLSLDQSGSKGVYGGVVVKWIGENAARQDAGDPKLKNVKLESKEVSGYIDVSDKLLRNAAAAGAICEQLLRGAIVGAEEDTFQNGSGVGKPYGIVNHPCVKAVTRNTANQVLWTDIKAMFSALMFGGQPVWIISQSTLPYLMSLADASGHALWMPNVAVGPGGTLCGLPVLINDLSPALGTRGDVCLCDLRYYWIKDGSPLAIFIDPYTQKANGVSRIYAFWNVDGQPMLTTPITQRNGTTTVSPFVVLV